jgi:DNA repair protein SbcC/Rad50
VIIAHVRVNPFGCFSSREIQFQEGLNVILGPNEAGKSTIFHALQKGLFTVTKLRKPDFTKEIARFLPVAGGDTIMTEVAFRIDGKTYILKRCWGASVGTELKLPDGSIMREEEAVSEHLRTLLPASPGTFRSVLMTYQSGLSQTIEALRTDHPETVRTLGDLLRRTILETDGVSVEEFRAKLEGVHLDYFSRWDRAANYPEKGRGIENPFKKEVGRVLEDFYEKETVRSKLEKARRFERAYDEVNARIGTVSAAVSELEKYVKGYQDVARDAEQRKVLSAEVVGLQSKVEMMQKVNTEWVVSESKVEELKGKIPVLEKQAAPLLQERKDAEAETRKKEDREKFKRITAKKGVLDAAEEQLKVEKKLTKLDLEAIRKAKIAMDQLELKIAAGKMKAVFQARKDMSVSFQKDSEDAYVQEMKEGQAVEVDAGGLVRVDHEDWQMEVVSGKGNVKENIGQHKEARRILEDVYSKHGISSMEDAIGINEGYEKRASDVERARSNLNDELGKVSYEDWVLKVAELGPEKTVRPIATIVEELVKAQGEAEVLRKELKQHEKVVTDYAARYQSKEELLLGLAEAVRRQKEIRTKMSELLPLPDGADDADAFLIEYEKSRKTLEQMKEDKSALLIERAELEKDMSEESTEELGRQLEEAEAQFRSTLKKAEAVSRIKYLTDEILSKMDTDLYVRLKNDVERYVSQMTDQRYGQVAMEDCLPEGFVRNDGKILTCERLSVGTKDVLALAVRLSMANYFLVAAKGCIVMDDPLVDLDPARQKRAAEILSSYGKDKQVIIFTCHPSHAELLGGHRVEL